MASVQMSQTLRDQITENYQKQLYAAYRKSHNVQGAIDTIVQGSRTTILSSRLCVKCKKTTQTLLLRLELGTKAKVTMAVTK